MFGRFASVVALSAALLVAVPVAAQLTCPANPPLRIEKGPYGNAAYALTSVQGDQWLQNIRAACTWGSGITFKGTVATAGALPASSTAGDCYSVAADGQIRCWNGSSWVTQGGASTAAAVSYDDTAGHFGGATTVQGALENAGTSLDYFPLLIFSARYWSPPDTLATAMLSDSVTLRTSDHRLVYGINLLPSPGSHVTEIPPGLHAASHQNGGDDEIDVTGLSGQLGDDQTAYARLAGRSGGQTLIGGTDDGDFLILRDQDGAVHDKFTLGNGAISASVGEAGGATWFMDSDFTLGAGTVDLTASSVMILNYGSGTNDSIWIDTRASDAACSAGNYRLWVNTAVTAGHRFRLCDNGTASSIVTESTGDARYAATSHVHAAGDITSGTFADALVDGSLEADEVNPTLGSQTQGNYAAGDAEAGAALTGDSATAFFSTGTIEVARGGTGAAPGADDQVLISSSTSAASWLTLPDSDAAGTILGYDVTTNVWSTKDDDDVPDAGDFGALALTGDVTSSGLTTTIGADKVTSGMVAFNYAGSGSEGGTATSALLTIGGGADDADSGLVRGSNNVNLVCAEKATTGTDSCEAYSSSDTWTWSIAGTNRLTLSATTLDFAGSTNTDRELTLNGATFGPGSQGSSEGWTFYKSGSSEDAITTAGYMVQSGNILGFDNGNAGSTTVKPQTQFKGGQSKTLVDANATAFVRLTMASGSVIGGTVTYNVGATNATPEFQSRSGVVPFSAVNKGGTITCTMGTPSTATEVVAVSTGTLAQTGFTCADAGTNLLELRENVDSSLSSPTVTMKWDIEVIGVQGTLLITPQ